MDHEHEREHSHATPKDDRASPVDEMSSPGRQSLSAMMRKPAHPVASGLVAGAGLDADTASRVEGPAAHATTGDRQVTIAPGATVIHGEQNRPQSRQLRNFLRIYEHLLIPEKCLEESHKQLAGAYLPGRLVNAERFILTQNKDKRGELERRLERLTDVWKAAETVPGAQTELKRIWKDFYHDWFQSHGPVSLNITAQDCNAILISLRKELKMQKIPITTSMGECGTAVHRIFKKMTGLTKMGHGYQWEARMDEARKNGEIAYGKKTEKDFKNLPTGSVIVWKGGMGHVCVVVGELWFSDYRSGIDGQGHDHTFSAIFFPTTPQ